MTPPNVDAGCISGDARRARDSTASAARVLCIYALSVAMCTSISAYAYAQAATTSRDVRATLNRSTTMTELNTVEVPRTVPPTRTTTENTSIRPFRVSISDEAVADLRRRLQATRWPTKELVKDRSQGVQLATLKELARYWATEYDWRKAEAKLNALPQFVTKIDGVDIHFIHVRSRHENALPLIMTHGWPGSVMELLESVGPLTDPTKYGGTAGDAFHLVLPSLPGYGFSGEPTELGWGSGRIARAWAELMNRLGYTRYVAQGGDVGSDVTDAMGRQAPKGLVGIHVTLLDGAVPLKDKLPLATEQERAALAAIKRFFADGFGYFLEQSTRPQTIGYSLLDSPIGLAAWMLDHDTDSYYKMSRAFVDGMPTGNLTRDNILDNITLNWLTGTGASSARWYWETARAAAAAQASGKAPPPVKVPVAFTTFPGEVIAPPRSWVEAVYPGLAYFNEVDRGGHFAAWEEPALFTSELRAAFKSLR
jgi:pimeloyl-ACP methyl ester carboxylesterase